LTEIRWSHYSGKMISEFHQLIEKVGKLAELARTLRRENAELRLNLAALAAENADLSKRMQEAHERVATLLDKIPVLEQDEEAA
jgi:cell division protein ZapB